MKFKALKRNFTYANLQNIKTISKHILDKMKSKSESPPYFIDKDTCMAEPQNIVDLFNAYFIQIGLTLVGETGTAKKPPFDFYLQNLIPSSFQFNYAILPDV